MPDLPTITVTSDQATKLLDAFGSVENYKTWLKKAVRDEALRRLITAKIQDTESEIPPVA